MRRAREYHQVVACLTSACNRRSSPGYVDRRVEALESLMTTWQIALSSLFHILRRLSLTFKMVK